MMLFERHLFLTFFINHKLYMNYSELLQRTKSWSNFKFDCIMIWRLRSNYYLR